MKKTVAVSVCDLFVFNGTTFSGIKVLISYYYTLLISGPRKILNA